MLKYNVDVVDLGTVASFYILGCCIGALYFGFLASNYGRKILLEVTLVLYMSSIFLSCFSYNFYFFGFCRFVTGVV